MEYIVTQTRSSNILLNDSSGAWQVDWVCWCGWWDEWGTKERCAEAVNEHKRQGWWWWGERCTSFVMGGSPISTQLGLSMSYISFTVDGWVAVAIDWALSNSPIPLPLCSPFIVDYVPNQLAFFFLFLIEGHMTTYLAKIIIC